MLPPFFLIYINMNLSNYSIEPVLRTNPPTRPLLILNQDLTELELQSIFQSEFPWINRLNNFTSGRFVDFSQSWILRNFKPYCNRYKDFKIKVDLYFEGFSYHSYSPFLVYKDKSKNEFVINMRNFSETFKAGLLTNNYSGYIVPIQERHGWSWSPYNEPE